MAETHKRILDIHFDYEMIQNTSFNFGGASLNPPVNAGDMGLIPGLGRFPGERNGNPLQYSCLENPMDRGTWWVTVHRVAKESDTT